MPSPSEAIVNTILFEMVLNFLGCTQQFMASSPRSKTSSFNLSEQWLLMAAITLVCGVLGYLVYDAIMATASELLQRLLTQEKTHGERSKLADDVMYLPSVKINESAKTNTCRKS